MTHPTIPEGGHAPADRQPRAPRSLAATVLAYVILSILALGSIWYIDRAVMAPAAEHDRAGQAP